VYAVQARGGVREVKLLSWVSWGRCHSGKEMLLELSNQAMDNPKPAGPKIRRASLNTRTKVNQAGPLGKTKRAGRSLRAREKWKGKIEIILTVALLATASLTILTFVVLPHVEIPTEMHLNSIDMLSSNEGWIVGGTLEGGITLRWDGVSWSVIENPFENAWLSSWFDSVDMLSSNEVWAVGNCGTILRWDGVSWSEVESPVENAWFNSIDILSSNEVWIVGGMAVEDDNAPRTNGIILRWDGVSWSVIENPFENAWFDSWFDSVDMLSSNEGWIVGGTSEYGIILRWDGVSWSEVESPVENAWFNSIDILSSNEVWIVGGTFGGGTILRWDGLSWSVFETPTPNFPYSVNVISSNEGWAVSQGGTILRWDGVNWSEVESPVENAWFNSIDILSSNEGWIVGAIVKSDNASGRGIILRWDGNRWSLFEPPTYEWLLWTFIGITIAIAALLLVVLYRKRR
jgi:hypothetical protein